MANYLRVNHGTVGLVGMVPLQDSKEIEVFGIDEGDMQNWGNKQFTLKITSLDKLREFEKELPVDYDKDFIIAWFIRDVGWISLPD